MTVSCLGEVKFRMKAIVCQRWGEPAEVLHVRDVPVPEPQRGEVRVRMLTCPINPSDLFMVRGLYLYQPPLPAIPGFEGVGIVETGKGLLAWRVMGRRVAVLNGRSGNWAEQVVIPARQAVPLPDWMSDDQAAMFFVNPASALVMARYVLKVARGSWLLQTAAGSALGRMLIRLGQHYGFRTLNVVRRREQAEELLRLGGTAVIATNEEPLAERALAITNGAGVPYAIDAVGGATGSEVVKALAPEGRMLLFSSLSGEPLQIPPRPLMNGHKTIEGFWLSDWVKRQNPLRMLALFSRLKQMIRQGILVSEVGATFGLDEITSAVQRAEEVGRQGKVLLRIGKR